jgi:hypothetical protein
MTSRARRCGYFTVLCAAAVAGIAAPAHAQAKLDIHYNVTFAGISIGQADWSATIGADRYTTTGSGGATGLIKVLASGTAEMSSQGAIKDVKPVPPDSVGKMIRDDGTAETKVTFTDGNVTELKLAAPPAPDRVPLAEKDKQGVIDPLSALLVPIAAGGLDAKACERTLPMFDGQHRFDLTLTFKRMDQVKAERGYQGPSAVCAVTFHPIAGHRASSTLTKYMSEGREMEMWLVPVAGVKLAAPFRLTVGSMIGNLTIDAKRFDAGAVAADGGSVKK